MNRNMCYSPGKMLVTSCLMLLLYKTCKALDGEPKCSNLCGDVNVSSPFRLMDSPVGCGDFRYELSCEQNGELLLYLKSGLYKVLSINYENYTIRVRDSEVPPLPAYSLSGLNLTSITFNDPYNTFIITHFKRGLLGFGMDQLAKTMIFVRCRNSVHSPAYVNTDPCFFNTSNGSIHSSSSFLHSYVNVGSETLSDLALDDGCDIELIYMTSWPAHKNNHSAWSCKDIHNMLLYGFELSWLGALCHTAYDIGYINETKHPSCLVCKYL